MVSAVLPVVSIPPYLGSCQAVEQVPGGQLLGLSDACLSLPISACSLFFFFISLCYFDYNMCLFIKEKDKLTRRMFCNQRYFHKTASISCFLHTVLERTRASSCLLGVRSSCNLQLMVRVSASGNFSSTHILSLPAVSFLQTETTNLHKVSSY